TMEVQHARNAKAREQLALSAHAKSCPRTCISRMSAQPAMEAATWLAQVARNVTGAKERVAWGHLVPVSPRIFISKQFAQYVMASALFKGWRVFCSHMRLFGVN